MTAHSIALPRPRKRKRRPPTRWEAQLYSLVAKAEDRAAILNAIESP